MQIHLDQELAVLRQELSIMCNQSMEALVLAIRALKNCDHDLAETVIANDRDIDMQENKVDGMLLAIVGLKQPFAIDLRFLVAAMKINNDLERVADKAATIAKAVTRLEPAHLALPLVAPVIEMAGFSQDMIRTAFDCFLDRNAESAAAVIRRDRELNEMNERVYAEIIAFIKSNTGNADAGINLYRIATALERIGDLAKNISEDAIYYVRGEIVRHRTPGKQD